MFALFFLVLCYTGLAICRPPVSGLLTIVKIINNFRVDSESKQVGLPNPQDKEDEIKET